VAPGLKIDSFYYSLSSGASASTGIELPVEDALGQCLPAQDWNRSQIQAGDGIPGDAITGAVNLPAGPHIGAYLAVFLKTPAPGRSFSCGLA